MRIRRPWLRLARVALGTFAGLALALTAAPVWAGQVNLSVKTTITTITTTETGSFANTALNTLTETLTGTFTETGLNTVTQTLINTDTGSLANTFLSTLTKTNISPGSSLTVLQTITSTDTGTIANTAIMTLLDTSANTIIATGFDTILDTATSTETGTFANTVLTTVTETMIFNSQPADVSIEISQNGMNLTSPFNNSLKALAIVNKVGVTGTRGISQVLAQSGNSNVSVASNALIDGPMLVNFSHDFKSQVALKELGVLALVPGFALQNSNVVAVSHIAGLALTAAETTAQLTAVLTDSTTVGGDSTIDESGGDDVVSVAVAVDIIQNDVNEYSAHGNVTSVASLVENQVLVKATSGISQVIAQAGTANTAGAHNVLLIDGTFRANGSAFNFNQ